MASKRLWFIPIAVLFIGLAAGIRPPQASSAVPLASQLECPIISPPINIGLDGLDQLEPSVAFNPRRGEFLVTWTIFQNANTWWDIWAARVALDGQIPGSFKVAGKGGELRNRPDVAFSPVQDQYIIVYQSSTGFNLSDLYYTMVNWNGSTMQAEGRVRQDSDTKFAASVAYNEANDEFLVVYESYPQPSGSNIAAQRLRANDGGRESWRQITASASGLNYQPEVAYSPWLNGYLIVSDQETLTIEGHYAWTNHDMSQLDSGNQVRDASDYAGEAQLAAGPGEYLYVWEKEVSGSGSDIYARRFDDESKPLGPAAGFPIAGEGDSGKHRGPYVAYAGSRGYLVVWSVYDSNHRANVLGAWVPTGQGQVAGDPFPIFDSAGEQWATSLACAPWGICLVAITNLADPLADIDIQGKIVRPCPRVHLPIVVR